MHHIRPVMKTPYHNLPSLIPLTWVHQYTLWLITSHWAWSLYLAYPCLSSAPIFLVWPQERSGVHTYALKRNPWTLLLLERCYTFYEGAVFLEAVRQRHNQSPWHLLEKSINAWTIKAKLRFEGSFMRWKSRCMRRVFHHVSPRRTLIVLCA